LSYWIVRIMSSVADLLAQFKLEDEEGRKNADLRQDEPKVDKELETLKLMGTGYRHEQQLQRALDDTTRSEQELRTQQARLRRFSCRVGDMKGASDELLSECLDALQCRADTNEALLTHARAAEATAQLRVKEQQLHEVDARAKAAEQTLLDERGRWAEHMKQHEEELNASRLGNDPSQQQRKRLQREHHGSNPKTRISSTTATYNTHTICPNVHGGQVAKVDAELTAEQLVHSIRRSRLLSPDAVAEADRGAVEALQSTLGRALEKLAKDLYSSSSQFVSEIIQNADDNKYDRSARAPPTLTVVFGEDAVLIHNNEVGMTRDDVRAITDVGRSTKAVAVTPVDEAREAGDEAREAGTARGAIGHKGIGFKSVFLVSDAPAIWSPPFCFQVSPVSNRLRSPSPPTRTLTTHALPFLV
jgi:hypothetical protein